VGRRNGAAAAAKDRGARSGQGLETPPPLSLCWSSERGIQQQRTGRLVGRRAEIPLGDLNVV
jgi:hypothetical protein